MPDSKDTASAPYISFTTFKNSFDKIKEHGLPTQLDNSYLYTFHNGTNARLFVSALDFFNLINGEREPTDELEQLVISEEPDRKKLLEEILKRHYPLVFENDLSRVTPSQFDSALDSYTLTGDTRRKQKAFLVRAIQYAGIKLNNIITKRTRTSKPRKSRKTSSSGTNGGTTKGTEAGKSSSGSKKGGGTANTKTIRLRNGEPVTFSAEISLFNLHPADREFLLGIVDQLQEHKENVEQWLEERADDEEEEFEEEQGLF